MLQPSDLSESQRSGGVTSNAARDVDLSRLLASKVIVVVAHPDDEILGCGALLARLPHVRIVHVTDGAPADPRAAHEHGFDSPLGYAMARRREAEAALSLANVAPDRITALGVVDQQASLAMIDIARALLPMLEESEVILTHAFEGGHSDHDAVALAVHAAWRLGSRRQDLIEMPYYHAGPDDWLRQVFLPHVDAGPELILHLDGSQRALKRRMIEAHTTQAEVLRSFDLDAERLRRAPAYRFTSLPHAGPLLYERHGWNLTAALWIERASTALLELGLARPRER